MAVARPVDYINHVYSPLSHAHLRVTAAEMAVLVNAAWEVAILFQASFVCSLWPPLPRENEGLFVFLAVQVLAPCVSFSFAIYHEVRGELGGSHWRR